MSDDVYLLFPAMEFVSRVFLTHNNLVKMQRVNIKAVLANRMFTNKLVQDYWSNLIGNKLNADSSPWWLISTSRFAARLSLRYT